MSFLFEFFEYTGQQLFDIYDRIVYFKPAQTRKRRVIVSGRRRKNQEPFLVQLALSLGLLREKRGRSDEKDDSAIYLHKRRRISERRAERKQKKNLMSEILDTEEMENNEEKQEELSNEKLRLLEDELEKLRAEIFKLHSTEASPAPEVIPAAAPTTSGENFPTPPTPPPMNLQINPKEPVSVTVSSRRVEMPYQPKETAMSVAHIMKSALVDGSTQLKPASHRVVGESRKAANTGDKENVRNPNTVSVADLIKDAVSNGTNKLKPVSQRVLAEKKTNTPQETTSSGPNMIMEALKKRFGTMRSSLTSPSKEDSPNDTSNEWEESRNSPFTERKQKIDN